MRHLVGCDLDVVRVPDADFAVAAAEEPEPGLRALHAPLEDLEAERLLQSSQDMLPSYRLVGDSYRAAVAEAQVLLGIDRQFAGLPDHRHVVGAWVHVEHLVPDRQHRTLGRRPAGRPFAGVFLALLLLLQHAVRDVLGLADAGGDGRALPVPARGGNALLREDGLRELDGRLQRLSGISSQIELVAGDVIGVDAGLIQGLRNGHEQRVTRVRAEVVVHELE